MQVKDIHLQQLKTEIERNPNNWLFPSENTVKGFMGEGGENRIMFVGERPSSKEHGIDSHRKKFYETLKNHHLEDSHVTDLFKSRGKVNDPYQNITDNWRWFKREIAIIDPRLIFTLSKKVHDYLFLHLIEKEIMEVKLYHYSHVFRYNKDKEFNKQIEQGLGLIQS